ncbi:hypothetical protein HHK36_003890 [Tetracentron sinense]|uniref:U1-type domain-containing protein n=1 Tax=Tetracentron sinense TaxID=13715 RepID=A0A835DP04_TETSI|nr:hypothetical protein HHK36_003890 [Tetracentron sinense]
MGFVVLLKLVAKIFDVLAWPLITVVYPLLPFWPYVKPIAACCMVLPHVDGATYVYNHFVRPCFPMILQTRNSWFILRKEDILHSRPEDFLIAVERYIKENGHETLEELINNKSKGTKPNPPQKIIKTMATTENNEVVAAAEWAKLGEPNITWTEKNIFPATENKEVAAVATATARGSELPDLPAPKEVQKEWTCSLCQVSISSKENLRHHFRGQVQQAKQQELKASKMVAQSEGSSTSSSVKKAAKKAKKPKVEPKNGASATGPNLKPARKRKAESTHCDKCNVWCGGKAVWLSHLNGKKHLAQLNKLA